PLRAALGLDGAPPRRWRVGMRAHFRLAPPQTQPPWVEVFLGRDHEVYLTPLPGGEVGVAVLAERAAVRGGAEAALRRWVSAHPALAARLAGAERRSPLMGAS